MTKPKRKDYYKRGGTGKFRCYVCKKLLKDYTRATCSDVCAKIFNARYGI